MNLIDAAILLVFAFLQAAPDKGASLPGGQPLSQIKRGHVASFPRCLTGKITDTAGKPISNARIEWGPEYPHDAPRESSVTTSDGSFRIELMKAGGRFKLGVSASGYCPQWRDDVLPGPTTAPTELQFQLLLETRIEVTIVGESGSPIPSLSVLPMTPQSGFNSSFSSVKQQEKIPGHDQPSLCNADGVCELRQLLPTPEPLLETKTDDAVAQKEYVERFNHEGWLSLKITEGTEWVHEYQISRKEYFDSKGRVKITVPNYRNPLTRRNYDGRIYAQVLDPDGQPVLQYQVTLRHHAEPMTVSDASGRFQWGKTLDPDRDYQLRVFAKGFAPHIESIVPKETSLAAPRRIELAPNKSTEFQLIDRQTQKPIANVPVLTGVSKKSGWNYVEWNDFKNYADGYHSLENVLHLVTDSDGRITLPEGLEPSTLFILAAGYGRLAIAPKRRPDPDEKGLVRIQLEPAATIRAIRDPNSRFRNPDEQLYLHVESSDDFEHRFHSLRGEEGKWFVDSLAPGTYHVGVTHSIGGASTACWLKTIMLKAGQHVDLLLSEMTGKLTLSGRTTPFTDVSLSPKRDPKGVGGLKNDVTVIATISDVDGYFELNGLHPGFYDVRQGGLLYGMRESRFKARASKGPSEIALEIDLHIDYLDGTIELPVAEKD